MNRCPFCRRKIDDTSVPHMNLMKTGMCPWNLVEEKIAGARIDTLMLMASVLAASQCSNPFDTELTDTDIQTTDYQ